MIFLNTGKEDENFALVRRWTRMIFNQNDYVLSFVKEGGLELVPVASIRCMVGWIDGKAPAASNRVRRGRLVIGNRDKIWGQDEG
jgi:hypothetical protein